VVVVGVHALMNAVNCRSYVIHLKRTFDFRNHVCMVFDVMGLSVFDFLKNNGFRPFPIEHVRTMAHQLLIGIQCMPC
jgi:hypothetical protein